MKINIDHGLKDLIIDHLGIGGWNKRSEPKLKPHQIGVINFCLLLSRLMEQMETNRRNADDDYPRSKENWRLETREDFDKDNTSKETILERLIVKQQVDDWFNQVPTCSGLFHSYAGRRKDIDLVHRMSEGCYEFIELKVCSNTPLYAAMEILTYGCIYLFTRIYLIDEILLKLKYKDLLEARHVRLVVLAPKAYFNGEATLDVLKVLERKLNDGLSAYLSDQNSSFAIDFQFQTFTDDFVNEIEPKLNTDSTGALNSQAITDRIRILFPENKLFE